MDNLKIGFVGAGNIASALIDGILRAGLFEPGEISIYDPDPVKVESLTARGVGLCASNVELAAICDIVVLAVKPQIMRPVLEEIGPFCDGRYIISVAAGISTGYVRQFANGAKVLRVMPNTPMLIGKGAVAIAQPHDMDPVELERLTAIFSCCGMVELIDEDKMNAIIAVNGSSPAYFYRFAEVMADYAESHGIPRDIAVRLASKSMEGAAAMLLAGEKSPVQLIKDVSSPGGTTLAALASMDDSDIDGMLIRAMEACLRRAYELAK